MRIRHALGFLAMFGTVQSEAASYTFTTLDRPGAASTQAVGINDAGQIVGFFTDNGNINHGFVRDNSGAFTTLNDPGSIRDTFAFGINAAGQIVGSYDGFRGLPHAFQRDSSGVFTELVVTGTFRIEALGINDAGQIVGNFVDNSGGRFGYLDTGGVLTTFADAVPRGINNAGQIVGKFDNGNGHIGEFLRDGNGTFTSMDVPGAVFTTANGINAAGQVVGVFGDGSGNHGFLRDSNGVFITIDEPDSIDVNTNIFGINAAGQIVGSFRDNNGTHGFLASPVPLPAAVWLLSSSFGAFAFMRRRVSSGSNSETGTFRISKASMPIAPTSSI